MALLFRSAAAAADAPHGGDSPRRSSDSGITVPREVYTAYEVVVEGFRRARALSAADAAVTAWRDPTNGHWHASEARIRLYADSLRVPGRRAHPLPGPCEALPGGAESYRRLMERRGYAGTMWIADGNSNGRNPRRCPCCTAGPSNVSTAPPMAPGPVPSSRPWRRANARGITPELRTAYSRSGFSHLLAVSGLHTGIVFALVNLLLGWLPLLRRGHLLRNLAVAAAVWLRRRGRVPAQRRAGRRHVHASCRRRSPRPRSMSP